MLEKPNLDEQKIVDCLQKAFGLMVDEVEFLPLGADVNTAVYRTTSSNNTPYFVKLRSGEFNEASVTVPKFLSEAGMPQIIAPLPTLAGGLWGTIAKYKVILYPFVAGEDGFERPLTNPQRIELGQAMHQFHTTHFPKSITQNIQRETFSPQFRNALRDILNQIHTDPENDPLAQELIHFLREKESKIRDLVQRTEQLLTELNTHPLNYILCHADIHGWNMLIEDVTNKLYMVDWDTLLLAPKERDLMFVGCSLGGRGQTLEEEVWLFYEGYGQTEINQTALAYYRYERIIEDIFEFCNSIFTSEGNGEDRVWALNTLKESFEPNNTLDLAVHLDNSSK